MRRPVLAWFVVVVSVLPAACGGSPTVPTPPPPPPPVNTAPVIDALTVSAERVEVDTEVTLTATVRDAETPVTQLRFEWSADGGTFVTDVPARARWRPPSDRATPADYRLTLTLVETYGAGNAQEHRVSATSAPVRVHNSVGELSGLAIDFLKDFSTPSVRPADAVRYFSDACPGKRAELEDVQSNRDARVINSYILGTPRVTVQYSGGCRLLPHGAPNGSPVADACMTVDVVWQSTIRASGKPELTTGVSILSGLYAEKRWWLCDSQFAGSVSSGLTFMR